MQGSPMDQGVGKRSFYGEVMQQGAPMSRVSVSLDIGWKRLVTSVKGYSATFVGTGERKGVGERKKVIQRSTG